MKSMLMAVLCACASLYLHAQENDTEWTSGRPDGHAPIGVMGDHIHKRGEWMLSYRYMHMQMSGNVQGSESIADRDIFNQYMVAPDNMPMQMHMTGAMYALSNRITLMGMLGYVEREMSHTTRMGAKFSTSSYGMTDSQVSALIGVKQTGKSRLHVQAGLVIPTGSVTKRAETPMDSDAKLPYPMQPGAGSFGIAFSTTYLYQLQRQSFGTQVRFTHYLNHNSESYRIGDSYELTAWAAQRIANQWSISLRVSVLNQQAISGKDPELMMPMMATTMNTRNTGRTQLNGGAGINYQIPATSIFSGLRVGAEFFTPVFQSVNGIQMDTRQTIVIGLQYSM